MTQACDHRHNAKLIAATQAFTPENRLYSWWVLTSTLILVAGAIGLNLYASHDQGVAIPIWGRLALSLLTSLLLVRLFVINHDYLHRAILTDSPTAAWVMRPLGLLILTPGTIWRSSHNYHHSHNCKLRGAHIGSFPIMTRDRFRSATPQEKRLYLFMRHPLTIAGGYFTVFLLGMCVLPALNNPRKHWDSLVTLVMHVGICAFAIWQFGLSSMVLALWLPALIACAVGAYLFYAQHNFPTVMLRAREGWTFDDAALNSSSYLVLGPLMRYFTANIGYHHVHHLNARIPFYRLPEAMAAIPELQTPRTTHLGLREVIACLRLKVWDPEEGKMAGL